MMRRMRALCRTARIAVSCAAFACAGWIPSARAARPRAADAPANVASPAPFRLGTAARPFGWSSAIGDLNADGRPDYAIADRMFRRASGFAYSLEFIIAGAAPRSVTFDAPDDALTVSLRDVDHDRDLDVVVSAWESRAVVGVWLNDGAGGFHRAPASAVPDGSASDTVAVASSERSDAAAAESASPRVTQALPACRRASSRDELRTSRDGDVDGRLARARITHLGPRAPPLAVHPA